MAKGIVRKIDHLGRICLPKEVRDSFDMKQKDPIGMYILENKIHLVKVDEKHRGIARELDELGRITLPIEVRKSLGFADRQPVDMYVECEEIIIVKYGKECAHCGSDHALVEDNGSYICQTCLYRFWDKFNGRR
jgi:transcriptional pleiotropic regulator of transition state genes